MAASPASPRTSPASASTEEALALFDSLEPVALDAMVGTWAGEEFPTRHPMDGLLGATGWYGKQFLDPDTVHPLLFHTADRRAVFPVDPARVPMGLPVPTRWPLHRVVTTARPLLRTSKPTARLRTTEFRGVATATMIYDAKPIHDVFRRLDADSVLGAMDYRGFDRPYFFVLRRDPGTTVL
jgi:hypothetical protein